MYSFKQILKQEPNTIREFILAVLAVLVMIDVINVSEEVVAGIGIVLSLGLGLVYVRPLSVSKDALDKLP